jgi:uncharacterized protein (TIGR03435 family)
MTSYAIRVSGSLFLLGGLILLRAEDFAVASVRSNPTANAGAKEGLEEKITLSPAGVIMWNVTLRSCIRWAYDMPDNQVFGPGWLASQHYDISAKAQGDVPVREMRIMMQRLLADRFQLAVRFDAKVLPVYEMTLAPSGKKRDRLKPSSNGEPSMKPEGGAIEFHGYSMKEFAERLAARPFKVDRPVMDKTRLEGLYDFKVEFAAEGAGMKLALEGIEQGSPGAPSMIPMLQDQLGLVFKAVKAPVDSLVVEHAEKLPTGN